MDVSSVGKVDPKSLAKIFGIRDIEDFKLDFMYRRFKVCVIGDNELPMKVTVSDDDNTYFNGEANKVNFRCVNEVVGKVKRLVDDIIDSLERKDNV